MTTPGHGDGADEPVDLGKGGSSGGSSGAAGSAEPFDPYRFGRPEHPVPPEYAPPGYVPDPPAATGPGGPSAPPGPYPPPPPYGQQPYGQQPYGQQPYGQQPPPPSSGGQPYGRVRTGNGKATTALVLGIGSIVFCWAVFFDLLLIVPAIVFGIVALRQARGSGTGRGMAIAGLACGIVGAILATVLTVLIVNAASKCGGLSNSDDPGFRTCVRDQFR